MSVLHQYQTHTDLHPISMRKLKIVSKKFYMSPPMGWMSNGRKAHEEHSVKFEKFM